MSLSGSEINIVFLGVSYSVLVFSERKQTKHFRNQSIYSNPVKVFSTRKVSAGVCLKKSNEADEGPGAPVF